MDFEIFKKAIHNVPKDYTIHWIVYIEPLHHKDFSKMPDDLKTMRSLLLSNSTLADNKKYHSQRECGFFKTTRRIDDALVCYSDQLNLECLFTLR